MHIVHVTVEVKQEAVEAFKEAIMENARCSMEEEGVLQFDVLQEQDHPNQFRLVEVYKTQEDQAKHRETAHFKKFKAAVPELLVKPYTFNVYSKVNM